MSLGVIVGRFQVNDPTAGHVELISKIREKCGKVCILVGCSPLRLSRYDPLDYPSRERMLRTHFPDATIHALPDQSTDEQWSRGLDDTIRTLFPTETNVTLFGSRDSFIPHYLGKFKTEEIPETTVISATTIRESLADRVVDTPDFRHGVIYCAANRFPISYQTVDIAVVRQATDKTWSILMGRKENDPVGEWRLPGGFVDPKDECLEITAAREAREELGDVEISTPKYIGSYRITDWRFKREDRVMTALLVSEFLYGREKAGDDLDEVRWLPLHHAYEATVSQHKILILAVQKHLQGL